MSFDKLVTLCKQASIQFKELSAIISKNRLDLLSSSKALGSANKNSETHSENQIDSHYEIENSNSPVSGALFLPDESYLTMTGDCFNRSANADCSGMDLDESSQLNISLCTSNNREFINRFYSQNIFNSKALTSTVSAQRTQALSGLKTDSNVSASKSKPTVTFNTKPSTSTSIQMTSNRQSNVRTSIESAIVYDSVSMPPPPASSNPGNTTASAATATSSLPYAFSLKNGCSFSRRIAEYFVAQQASLIENNEHDALSPVELNQKIDELLAFDSNFADAYYLKYLNYLRLRDYPSSLKALHDYFDRAIYAGSVSLAALNLCSLEYRFDNKENALFALKEAITSAHHEGDNACLQHCLVSLIKYNFFNENLII